MRRLSLTVTFLLMLFHGFALAQAPARPAAQSPAQPGAPTETPAVPTTKILAIGRIVAANAANRRSLMPSEVRETVKLYLAGKIDQWYVRKDQPGVVFLMNVATVQEAHELLEALPLGRAGVMEFDLIPVGPLSPLNFLLSEPSKTP